MSVYKSQFLKTSDQNMFQSTRGFKGHKSTMSVSGYQRFSKQSTQSNCSRLTLKKQLIELKEDNQVARYQLSKLQAYDQQIKIHQNELEREKENYERKQKYSQEQINKLRTKEAELEQIFSQKNQTKINLDQKILDLQKKIYDTQDQIDHYSSKFEIYTAKKFDNEKVQIAKFQKEFYLDKEENKKLIQKTKLIEEDVQEVQNQIENEKMYFRELQQRLQDLNKEKIQIQTKNSYLQDTFKKTQDFYEEKKSEQQTVDYKLEIANQNLFQMEHHSKSLLVNGDNQTQEISKVTELQDSRIKHFKQMKQNCLLKDRELQKQEIIVFEIKNKNQKKSAQIQDTKVQNQHLQDMKNQLKSMCLKLFDTYQEMNNSQRLVSIIEDNNDQIDQKMAPYLLHLQESQKFLETIQLIQLQIIYDFIMITSYMFQFFFWNIIKIYTMQIIHKILYFRIINFCFMIL